MKITCWGSRGSIPVSGNGYDKYGGDTTCIEIRSKDDRIIIIDAGTGIRSLGNKLISESRLDCDMIFTHAHWDHLMGFPFFKPIYMQNTSIQMHGCPFAQSFVEKMLSKVMSPPNFPVKYSDIMADITYTPNCPDVLEIGSIVITPIRLSHPNQGNGYKFVEDGKSFVFLTDNELGYRHAGGLSFKDYMDFSSNADLLIHDGEYTEEEYKSTIEWGHSTYTEALELAIQAKVKRFGLFHLNQDRLDADMDRIVKECREIIKAKGIDMECFAVGTGMSFDL